MMTTLRRVVALCSLNMDVLRKARRGVGLRGQVVARRGGADGRLPEGSLLRTPLDGAGPETVRKNTYQFEHVVSNSDQSQSRM